MTISITPNAYPIFEANQVLKFSDLNSLFDYLDGHNRLTRTHLIGMGIVCGLKVTLTTSAAATTIAIAPGCGVTSEGYLIRLDETTLTHFDEVAIDKRLFEVTPPTTSPQPTTENGNGNSNGNSNLSAPPISVIELFEGAGEDTDRQPLSSDIVNDHVLVVVCEIDESQRDSCLADCDNRGRDRQLRGRYFLLPRAAGGDLTADALLRQGYQIDSLEAPWDDVGTGEAFTAPYTFWQDAQLRVRRFGYGTETPTNSDLEVPIVRLSAIKTFDALMENYSQICEAAIAQIEPAFTNLYRLFSPLFSTFQPDSLTAFEGLSEHLQDTLNRIRTAANPSQLEAVEAQYAIQYFYDYLSQLVAAYDELTTVAFDLMADCVPDRRRFPKYLMLGIPAADEQSPCDPPSPYRTHFVQPPIYNGNGKRLQQVQHLYQRLLKLCADDAFFMLPFYDTPLALTPSPDRSAPLSQQAIPYYLNYPQIYRYWNYDACRKGISDRHPAYFFPLSSGAPATTTDVLVHRLDAYNFYRIEGHIGETRANALEQIKNYQQRYSLAFDVIVLKLDNKVSLEDLNISGQFDDLEADFGSMKDRFQKLWQYYSDNTDNETNSTPWRENALLNTLKREFFDQPDLASIDYFQLFNPVLQLAENPQNFLFDEQPGENQTNRSYFLYLADADGNFIARFSPQANTNLRDDLLEFSGNLEAIQRQQAEIKIKLSEKLTACRELGGVRYRILPEGDELYALRQSIPDTLELPSGEQKEIGFLTLDRFSVARESASDRASDRLRYIREERFHDFETLYSLISRDPAEEEDLPSYLQPHDMASKYLNYYELKALMTAYRNRLDRLMELHLFYKFAEQHPGLEPLGGVPKGGTFVLVYVDGEEVVNDLKVEQDTAFRARTSAIKQFAGFPFQFLAAARVQEEVLNRVDMVVADFCLPYRCCSDTPAVSYLLSKPRPIVLLEKSAFCEDDSGEYDFILDPAGGTLKGDGVAQREDGTYFFQPNQVGEVISDRTVTFVYAVEGSYDTFTVAIYPEPTGTLNIEDGAQFCNDDESINIQLLRPITDPAIELVAVTVDENKLGDLRFVPSQYAQNGEQADLVLVALLRDRRTDCDGTLDINVIVYPAPNPAFSIEPAGFQIPGSEVAHYCAGDGGENNVLNLEPTVSETSNRFELTRNGELLNDNTRQINLNDFGQEGEDTLEITHFTDVVGVCSSQSSTQTIKILSLPDASFDPDDEVIDDTNRAICSNTELSLNPKLSGGTFKALIGDTEQEIPGAIAPDSLTFIAKSAFEDNDLTSQAVTLRHEIINEFGCSNAANYSLTVYRVPEASFALPNSPVFSANPEQPDEFSITISEIEPEAEAGDYIYSWSSDAAISSLLSRSDNAPFSLRFSYASSEINLNDEISVSLTVINAESTSSNISCQSEPFTESFLPPFEINDWVLVAVQGENEIQTLAALTAFIKENGRISLMQFFELARNNQAISLQPLTKPSRIGSVQITEQLPISDAPREVVIDEFPYVSQPWQPVPGSYTFTLRAFAGIPLESRESESFPPIRFEIFESDADGGDRPPSDPEGGGGGIVTGDFNRLNLENSTPLFNERLNRYREQLLAIGIRDSDIESSRAFSEAEDFIARRDKGIDDFRQLVETLQRSFRPSGSERQGELTEVLAIVTAALFDHLAQTATGETNLTALEVLLEELRQSELNLSRVREFWAVEPLMSVADPVLLERLEEQL